MMIYFFMMMVGVLIYVTNYKHVLIMLMSLEYMLLVVFMMLVECLCMLGGENQFLLIYIVFIVCESAVALGVLVTMIRNFGNDYFSSLCLLSC
uniref:NADH-ubiquinone oxidoreductase chain 4L n=1 Tax=Sphaerotheriidae sp. HYS-2012 TaxID=1170231 RepID=I6PD50_9MYRI|nr:NADH dehydrogenase subunit 4L [Sphaerotheriidae sp. HYS-2012]AFH54820.1 NADH dehydrogenase subunit 4L [Sphaerotheriidae sp. HYS-2012]